MADKPGIAEINPAQPTMPEKADLVQMEDLDQKVKQLKKENPYYADFATRGPEWKASFEKKFVRRIDLRLMPLLILMYLNNFLDRASLAQARLGGLEEDLNMTGTDFNLAVSMLFVGYLTMQLPSNLLITRIRPSLYLGVVMTVWGVVCASIGGVTSFTGLVVVRVFLGVTEAPFFPGAVFLLSSWYTRRELSSRIAWLYSGVALANMFGGLMGAGILGNMDGDLGLAGWRWLFIINGIITIFFGVLSIFVLPNFPTTTKWLSEEQRAFAQWRLRLDAEEDDESEATSLWVGLKLCLTDYRLYIFILLQHLSILTMTFQYFFPSIMQTLDYDNITTLLLTVPVWFVAWCAAILATWTAGRTGDRSIHIMCMLVVSAIGNAIVTGSTNLGARMFGMYLMPIGAVPAFQIIVAWIANSFIRPMVKRSSAIAICNMIGNCASIWGSYIYPSSSAPQYTMGGSINASICIVVALLALVLRLVHQRENKKLARAEQETAEGRRNSASGWQMKTGFRYVY